LLLSVAALAPAALVGCSALGGSSGTSGTQPTPEGAAGGTGAVETADLVVGVLPIVGAAPLTLGVSRGLFTEAGLTITPQPVQSGALSLPALVAGEFDVLFSNYVSPIAASAQGIDVVIIAEASRALPDNFGVVALPDSPVNTPTDLIGRTIGVNALNNIGTLTMSSVLGVNGVTPEQVTFVEVPFPEMATAIETGRVDAGFLPEPFLTTAKRALGVKTIFDPCSGPTADLPIDGYVMTREFADANPGTVRAFRTALVQAQEQASDRAVLEPLLVEAARVDPEVAALLSVSAYSTSTNATAIQRVADLMTQFGALDAPVDVAPLVQA
jgi:NitT/TauT family transport system substrate-binding protein